MVVLFYLFLNLKQLFLDLKNNEVASNGVSIFQHQMGGAIKSRLTQIVANVIIPVSRPCSDDDAPPPGIS